MFKLAVAIVSTCFAIALICYGICYELWKFAEQVTS